MKLLLSGGSLNPLAPYYEQELSALGHECRVLYPGAETPDLSAFDGLLLTGGADIRPERFGAVLLPNGSESLDLPRDELEFPLFAAFAAQKKPVWGICRGLQVINVALGGTLVQDLPSQRGLVHSAPQGAPPMTHVIFWEDGAAQTVNSYHHQAADRLGLGLTIRARAADGTVEALAHETLPIRAVQWHPERMDGEMRRLFRDSF